jgi:glucose 1-dehydrogenase
VYPWRTSIGKRGGSGVARDGAAPAGECQGKTIRPAAAGKTICMSSVHQLIPWAGHINDAAARGGVELTMKRLAQEVASRHIRVNAIAPGAIRSRINGAAWQTAEAREKLLALIPYGRIGEAEDVAKVATWLASDESDYVTGTTIFVDGGMSLYPAFRDNG